MSEDKPCRRYEYVPTHGKRPGRQRTSYILYVQRLLGDAEGDLHENAIASDYRPVYLENLLSLAMQPKDDDKTYVCVILSSSGYDGNYSNLGMYH